MTTQNQNIDRIVEREQQLLARKSKLEALFAADQIDAASYKQKLAQINRHLEGLHSRIDDSIADMLFSEIESSVHINEKTAMPTDRTAKQIEILDVIRGHSEGTRVFQVKFMYGTERCKARLNNDGNPWTFSQNSRGLSRSQFIAALEADEDAVKTFQHELMRHPEDWEELVLEERPKDYPRQAAQALQQDSSDSSGVHKKIASGQLKVHQVHPAPLSAALVKKRHGQDHYMITVSADLEGRLIHFTINSDTEKWSACFADNPEEDCDCLIPQLLKVLEEPHNHLYVNRMRTDIRKHRTVWEHAVSSQPSAFPKTCRELFS